MSKVTRTLFIQQMQMSEIYIRSEALPNDIIITRKRVIKSMKKKLSLISCVKFLRKQEYSFKI